MSRFIVSLSDCLENVLSCLHFHSSCWGSLLGWLNILSVWLDILSWLSLYLSGSVGCLHFMSSCSDCVSDCLNCLSSSLQAWLFCLKFNFLLKSLAPPPKFLPLQVGAQGFQRGKRRLSKWPTFVKISPKFPESFYRPISERWTRRNFSKKKKKNYFLFNKIPRILVGGSWRFRTLSKSVTLRRRKVTPKHFILISWCRRRITFYEVNIP